MFAATFSKKVPDIEIKITFLCLNKACRKGHIELFDVLMSLPESIKFINNSDAHGRTCFMEACSGGNIEIVNSLLCHPQIINIINQKDKNEQTAFLHACRNARVDVVSLLLDPELFNVTEILNASHPEFVSAYEKGQLTKPEDFIHLLKPSSSGT